MTPALSTLVLAGLLLAGAGGDDPSDDREYDGSAGETRVGTPRLSAPGVEVDGRLTEEAWSRGALLQGFTQYEPVEGAPASQRTEVSVFVTADALYVGIRAFDDTPEGIRATLAERDNVTDSDDYVRLVLDTFDDQRRAYAFTVNPLGVQQDGIWVEGGGGRRGGFGPPIDDNPDFLWESAGRVEDWGYALEVRIPFKSLRFPDRQRQRWGIQVIRRIQRNGYESSWSPISGDVANQLTQSGHLMDLRDLDPGLFLEMNPVLTASRVGTVDDGGVLEHGDPNVEFGGNVTYGLTSNLTLDATYNPDFSQVEADAGQIAVNERFALFFPEKRPFFLEGTEIFSLPQQLVYTRSIVDPVAGAKITGKVGSFNLGYLGAVDRAVDEEVGGSAVVNLLRLRRDMGAASTVGLVYTDRTVSADHYNRVAGADARLVIARQYTLQLQGAGSVTGDAESTRTGGLLSARLERSSRTLSFTAQLEDSDEDFVAGSGFLRRTGETQLRLETRYNRRGPPGALLERWGPTLEAQAFWDHDRFWSGGGFEEADAQLGMNFSFRNNLSIFTTGSVASFESPRSDYRGLFRVASDGTLVPFRPDPARFDALYGLRFFVFLNTWERVRGRLRTEWREVPVFDPELRVPVATADAWMADWSLTFLPTRSLSAQLGLRHESLFLESTGDRYSSATIPRLRAQYQFTRSLFLRGIFEYASQQRNALLDPAGGQPLAYCDAGECEMRDGSDGFDVHVEGLIAYEPSPGTVLFLGYSRDMRDTGAFAFRDVRPENDGLFAKVSYRFRF